MSNDRQGLLREAAETVLEAVRPRSLGPGMRQTPTLRYDSPAIGVLRAALAVAQVPAPHQPDPDICTPDCTDAMHLPKAQEEGLDAAVVAIDEVFKDDPSSDVGRWYWYQVIRPRLVRIAEERETSADS